MTVERPRVLAVLPALFPSTIIGVATPLQRLHRAGRIRLDLTLQYFVSPHRVARADVVVLCHALDPRFGGVLARARALAIPVIYEIDDNLLEVPGDVPGLAYMRSPARRRFVEACVVQADLVRTYAPVLRDYLSRYSPRVALVPGPIDWSLIPQDPPHRSPDVVRVVYATSRQQDELGQSLAEPLGRALDEDPRLELTVWGSSLAGLRGHPRVRVLPFVHDYERFMARFAREGFDIGLAPLPDDLFHQSKSDLKFRDYAACRIAGVYADTPVYRRSVVDGVTGLLVGPAPGEWVEAIRRLTNDPGLRAGIQERAHATALERYGEGVTDRDWVAQIQALTDRPLAPRGRAAPLPALQARRSGSIARTIRQLAAMAGQGAALAYRHGPGEAWRRARQYSLLSWKLKQSVKWAWSARRRTGPGG